MKMLVTGGAGFIGSHLTDLLVIHNNKIVIIDNLSSGKKENINSRAIFYQEDLSNFEKIKEIFEKEKPEIVYHLAAQINVRKSIENPIEDAGQNIINTLNLLELSVKHKVRHFIFSSSGGAIYGESEIPKKENELENPLSPYGISKLAIERYIKFYNQVHGLKYTILRYSNVYGPRQNSEGEAGVISIFLEKMLKKETPVIFGGLQTRDFVYIEDVVRANLLALNDKKSETYNIGTGVKTDIIEVFNKLNILLGNTFNAEYKDKIKGELVNSCLDYSKIKENLYWIPENNLDKGIKKTLEWFKDKKLLPSTMPKLNN